MSDPLLDQRPCMPPDLRPQLRQKTHAWQETVLMTTSSAPTKVDIPTQSHTTQARKQERKQKQTNKQTNKNTHSTKANAKLST